MSAVPEWREYCTNVYVPERGEIKVPNLPGLGQELSDKAMAEAIHHIVVQ